MLDNGGECWRTRFNDIPGNPVGIHYGDTQGAKRLRNSRFSTTYATGKSDDKHLVCPVVQKSPIITETGPGNKLRGGDALVTMIFSLTSSAPEQSIAIVYGVRR
jgi:hypothetical protein